MSKTLEERAERVTEDHDVLFLYEDVLKELRAVQAEERERCARIVEQHLYDCGRSYEYHDRGAASEAEPCCAPFCSCSRFRPRDAK